MRRTGVEPVRVLPRRILSPVRLPISPSPQVRVIHSQNKFLEDIMNLFNSFRAVNP